MPLDVILGPYGCACVTHVVFVYLPRNSGNILSLVEFFVDLVLELCWTGASGGCAYVFLFKLTLV